MLHEGRSSSWRSNRTCAAISDWHRCRSGTFSSSRLPNLSTVTPGLTMCRWFEFVTGFDDRKYRRTDAPVYLSEVGHASSSRQ